MSIVPRGKSLVFPGRAGGVITTALDYLLTSTEDVQRALAGRYTPYGHRLHTRRYDAGLSYPNVRLFDSRPDEILDTGVWRLPLREGDFRVLRPPGAGSGRVKTRSPGSPLPGPIRSGETLADLLRRLPDGKYVVEACRVFPPGRMKTPRGQIMREEELRALQRPGEPPRTTPDLRPVFGVEGRSSPGSLSVTQVTDSRSGDSSREFADSLMDMMRGDPDGVVSPKVPFSTRPKHRDRPRRKPRQGPRKWDRRRAGYGRKDFSHKPPDAWSRTRAPKTAAARVRSAVAAVPGPREALRRFRRGLTDPLRDPLRRPGRPRRNGGSSSVGST
ncbi:MAG: hypothetical protein EOO66_05695 [Methylobacterium sp.]|nr:MAG: hypothetical protein EOO66_05695 [Methylobacterium sp.]